MVENPASTRAGTWWRHRRPLSGKPCRSTTGGPSPVTSYSMPTPLTSTRITPPPRQSTTSGRYDGQQLGARGPELRCVAPCAAHGLHRVQHPGVGEDLVDRAQQPEDRKRGAQAVEV